MPNIAPTTDSAMYQTIQRQPQELRRLLAEGWEPAARAAEILSGAIRIYLVGIGTSLHAAMVGSWLLRAAGYDARAISSFDFTVYPEVADLRQGDAVVVMAHSGIKTYSSGALARAAAAGVPRISVGSLTAEHPGSQLIVRTVEREKSAAFTASHLAAMTVLAQIAAMLGDQARGRGTGEFRPALEALPQLVADVLRRQEEIRPVAEAAAERRIYVSGAGPNEATALEAVIKVREAAQGWIDALALEQFLHGPIVGVNEGDQAAMVSVPGKGSERVAEVTRLLADIGAHLWLIGAPVEGVDATVFALPPLPEPLSPLLSVVPVQLFAYFMAAKRGINPDRFRRDEPRYNDAFGRLAL